MDTFAALMFGLLIVDVIRSKGVSDEKATVILTGYLMALFGAPCQLILSAIVLLAFATTVICLISACADYFSSLTPLSYKKWAVILAVICAVVANLGLNQLIALSVPVLFALYPVAIALVALTLVRKWLPNPRLAYRVVLLVSFIFSMIDVAQYLKFDVSMFSILPLFNYGMGWVLSTLIALAVTRFAGGKAMSSQDKLA